MELMQEHMKMVSKTCRQTVRLRCRQNASVKYFNEIFFFFFFSQTLSTLFEQIHT